MNELVGATVHNANIIVKIDKQDLPIETVGLYEQNTKTGSWC